MDGVTMTDIAMPDGSVTKAELDYDGIVAYERGHPSWSLLDAFDGDKVRFSMMEDIASFILVDGSHCAGWKDLRARTGMTVTKAAEVIKDGMEELGFTSGE